ncbi:MAG: ACT domain-containing protein [Kiritimatiellae bacterium]|nr:ACT domain-containing protein [Kiritimatiellia bacterium]
MNKAIITVVGKDTIGILAKVCTYLAENKMNILDITQSVVQGYFNMMMIVDISVASKTVGEAVTDFNAIGETMGLQIKFQKSEIFEKMHRV